MSKLDHAASLTSSDAASTRKATLQQRTTNRKSINTGYKALYLRRKVAREVAMWSKKKPDTTQAADPEPTSLQTNQPPKLAPAFWEGTTRTNKDVMRLAGTTEDRAASRLGLSLHLKGEISGNEDLD